MKKRVVIAAALVAALAGGHAVAGAQAPRGGPGMRSAPGPGQQGGPRGGMRGGPAGDLGLRGIQLTEAQRDQVRSIMETHREEFAELRSQLGAAHRAFAEAAGAGELDEAAIRTQSAAVANAMADEAILRARVRAQVHALLTAEQQQQLKEREAAMQKRLQERQERLKQRQPPPPPPQ
ncbi:MAG TPA: Spy/CpxP family protein refolding chaperone [Vicinamibacterales bacterium]|nr:Spy/CpxP family protein refolding chaperone [Vicinamibacterales bacterium]